MNDYPKYVYMITQLDTLKKYIGITTNVTERLASHFASLKSGKHIVEDMQNDFNKYGMNYSTEVLEVVDKFDEMDHEVFWQNKFNSLDRNTGYNYKQKQTRIIRTKKQIENRNIQEIAYDKCKNSMDFNREPISVWRAKLCMSQRYLAKVLNVSPNTINRWETGKCNPSVEKWIEMGNVFGCGIDNIFLPLEYAKSVQKVAE